MRPIDADALRAVLIPLEQKYAGAYADLGAALGCIVQQIDRLLAVNAVIVTRCKDCKYGDYDSKPNGAMVCLQQTMASGGRKRIFAATVSIRQI